MTAAPWMKFYPADWRSDPKLRLCSLAARGLWMEMLALMHEAEPYGHLTVGGRAMTPRELANLAGIATKSASKLLDELEMNGVFSRDSDGVIYSRRMVRDAQKAQKHRENGAKGGNPKLIRGVNPEDKAQKPEARSQIPDKTPPVVPPKGDERQAELIPSEKTDDEPTRTRSRTRLPQDWRHLNEPPNDQHRHALQQGLSDTTAVREWQKFVNHHVAKGSTMANWPAAWRTWVDNVPSFNRGARDGRKQTGHETFERVARRIYERETAAERGAGEPDGGPLDAGPGDGGGTDRQAWVALSAPARERES